MSWASRRRATYLGGVILFFTLLIGVPLANRWYSSIPPACPPGTLRPNGAASGPCSILDPNSLSPSATLWARSFEVRLSSEGSSTYTALAYIENPNSTAGVAQAHYHFGLYDAGNVLVAEKEGATFIMPGGITPVSETGIDTGKRVAVHTYFHITDERLTWQRMTNTAADIKVSNQEITDTDTMPRITARAHNTSFAPFSEVSFVAVVFDPYGNAIAASRTALPGMGPDATAQITFTWPQPFSAHVGRIDIIPLLPPQAAPPGAQ